MSRYKSFRSGFLWITLVIISSLFGTIPTTAQTGNIEGFVQDANTGKRLAYAYISIQDERVKCMSDWNGRFYLENVPYGEQILISELPGYATGKTSISMRSPVFEAGIINLDFTGDETGNQYQVIKMRDRARVNALQLMSPVIGNSLTSAEMLQNGDFNLAEGLIRMPGMQVGRFGELNFRGAGRNRLGVQMDGMPLAATDFSGRNVDLGLFPSDVISHVQLISSPTPDMDATGIGGMVQIHSWQPVGNREIEVYMGGVALSEYSILNGLGRVANVDYSERFNDNFSMAAQLTHQLDVTGYESLGIDYGLADFGDGFVDVIDRLSPALHGQNRARFSGRLQFGYQPDTRKSFYLIGMSGTDNRDHDQHRSISYTNNDWIDQTTTGSMGQRGFYYYNPSLSRNNVAYNIVQAGGERIFNNALLNFSVGWSNTVRQINNYDFTYTRDRLNYSVNMDNRLRPELMITNIPLMGDGSVDQSVMAFDGVDRLQNEQFENRYSARAGLDVPLGILKVKLGSSLLYTQSERRYEEGTYNTLRRYNLIRFQKLPRSSFEVFDRYYFPDLIDSRLAALYVDTSRPEMRVAENDMFERSLIRNYEMDEMILGGFFMATLSFGSLELSGGVRGELTRADYSGRNVVFNQFRFFDSSVSTTSTVDYLNLLPYARMSFSPANHTNVKLVLSRSLERQGHDILAPFELIIPSDTLRFKGNPNLKPVISDNLDLGINHLLSDNSVVSLGLYYKRITNFVTFSERIVNETEFPFLQPNTESGLNVHERTYDNIDSATDLMGVMVSWQQRLTFLPGFLRNVGFNTNYTWSYTDKKDKRNSGDIYLRHHSPHVVNAAFMYTQNRISAQVAWHWSASSVFMKANELQWAPAVDRNNPVYLDLFEDGWMDLSLYAGFRISDKFSFWANVQNLLTDDRALYGDSWDTYAFDSARRNGVKVITGIRFTY